MEGIKKAKNGEYYQIAVAGEIDAGSSIYLDNALKEAMENNETKIIVDLSELSYISSAGLGVFISHLEEFNQNNIQLVLFGITESVRQVFDILGLEKLLTIVDTQQEALEAFNE